MDKSSEEQAAAKPVCSVGEGRPPPAAGVQAARPEDHITLLLRLFPLARSCTTNCALWPRAPPCAMNVAKCLEFRLSHWMALWLHHSVKPLKPLRVRKGERKWYPLSRVALGLNEILWDKRFSTVPGAPIFQEVVRCIQALSYWTEITPPLSFIGRILFNPETSLAVFSANRAMFRLCH